MNKQKINKQAFTLIELIIVITILAILGTIAYISMVGYIEEARDYTRMSDMHVMETSLEIFQLNAGKYPETTNGFTVTYSGSEVWSQGTFGKSTKTNIGNWDRGPNDPLTDKEYTYSVTKDRQEFLLGGILEGEPLTRLGILSRTNAGDIIRKALVSGNYNGVILKTLSGANCEILSLPSIISSLPETTTNLSNILTASGLVYTGYNNLPTNYRTSKFNADGGFNFTSNKLIVYSDNNNCSDLLSSESQGTNARATLITNIQTAYSGTVISSKGNIGKYTSVDTNDSNAVALLGNSLVNNNLGGKLDLLASDRIIVLSIPSSCKEILDNGDSTGDGIYTIDPGVDGTGFDVYCDMTTDGGGWLLFANHGDGITPTEVSAVSNSSYGVMEATKWSLISGNYTDLLFIDENDLISKISQIKLESGNCSKLSDVIDLTIGARLIHNEDYQCILTGLDYSIITLKNSLNTGASIAQLSAVKFDTWNYSDDQSYDEQNELMYFIR